MSRIGRLLILSGLTALAAYGQLYLLTAFPTSHNTEESPSYPSSILSPDGEGGVAEVRQIVAAQPGVSWVGVS